MTINAVELEIGSYGCRVTLPEDLSVDSSWSWEDWLQFAVHELPEDFQRWTGIRDGEEHLLKVKDSETLKTLAERKTIRASRFDRATKDLPAPLAAPSSSEAAKEAERVAAEIVDSIISSPAYIEEQSDYHRIDAILEEASAKLIANQKIVAVPTRDGDIVTEGSVFFAVVEPTDLMTSDIENGVMVVCETPYWIRSVDFINGYLNGEVGSLEESLRLWDYFKIVEELPIPRNPALRHWQEYDKCGIVDNERFPIELPPPPDPPEREGKTGVLQVSISPVESHRSTGERREYEAPEEARNWHWDSQEWRDFIIDRIDDFDYVPASPNNGGCHWIVHDNENDENITKTYIC